MIMVLSLLDKQIIRAALIHWSFKYHAVEDEETRYVDKEAYENLVERIEKEIRNEI